MTKRILVVDDEELVRELLCEILNFGGYEFDSAINGVEAVQKYKEALGSDQPFDAIIMDLIMPEMGGKEAMKKLLEIDSEIKAIVSSGYCNDPILANFQEYGFRSMLQKPYGVSTVQKELEALFG